ncbi:hypothetical protein ACG02S_00115 [Roseateles sp. DC23W]|uniref:Ribbon-helix-helix protein, copG family n=1 Tax=Pelomonas dachongensis TaxID=3299029 RepID=A0ABW7EJU9_9BURK
MNESLVQHKPEQLSLRDEATALPVTGLEPRRAGCKSPPQPCDKLQVILGSLGPRLRAYAVQQQTSMAVVVRRAVLKWLDEELGPATAGPGGEPFEHSAHNVQFHLNLPAAFAAELTARARAADMTRGEFVWSLLKGLHPPALPDDHAAAILALRISTDRVATISTDLAAYLRLLNETGTKREDFEPYVNSVRSLQRVVGEHLEEASMLIKELKPYRRARW